MHLMKSLNMINKREMGYLEINKCKCGGHHLDNNEYKMPQSIGLLALT